MDCENECSVEGTIFGCSEDGSEVLKKECGNFDMDFCLEYKTECRYFFEGTCLEYGDVVEIEVVETCDEGWECNEEVGRCVEPSKFFNLTCEGKESTYMGCVDDSQDATICAEYDGRQEVGGCNYRWPFGYRGDYTNCWNYVSIVTECSENPCPSGYTETARESCVPPGCVDTTWTPLPASICIGKTFTQISNCGTTKSAVGTKNCVASLSASYVITSIGKSGIYTYYYYDILIKETGGVGVTLTSRQVCYDVAGCDPIKTDIAYQFGTDYITPNGEMSKNNINWYTSYPSDRITQTFWGVDDNGNPVSVSYSMNHPL